MKVALSLMAHDAFRAAALPLFEAGLVTALHVTLDTVPARGEAPWIDGLVDAYRAEGRLYGHIVSSSLLDGAWRTPQHVITEQVAREAAGLVTLSDHFGFLGSARFKDAAPLPCPLDDLTLAIASDRLDRLHAAAGVPVGVENLAFSFSRDDCFAQARFVSQLVCRGDRFLELDLHNLWCQLVNFDLDADALLAVLPLERVRVLHVSGGSWSGIDAARVRRDTHDDRVPDEVWALLDAVVPRCAAAEVIVLERLGAALATDAGGMQLAADLERLSDKADDGHPTSTTTHAVPALDPPIEDTALRAFQDALLHALVDATNAADARARIEAAAGARFGGWATAMEPRMIDAAMAIQRAWVSPTAGL